MGAPWVLCMVSHASSKGAAGEEHLAEGGGQVPLLTGISEGLEGEEPVSGAWNPSEVLRVRREQHRAQSTCLQALAYELPTGPPLR